MQRTGREDRQMPGPGGLPAQQPARIIGRDGGLARLRALVDPVPPAGQVLLVTGEAGVGHTALLAGAARPAPPAGDPGPPASGPGSKTGAPLPAPDPPRTP